ncbi:MAG: septum formation initiator family protein [Clostridiales bacterium]|nr:septum formation initiator family protein [Clostridiales bacterium]
MKDKSLETIKRGSSLTKFIVAVFMVIFTVAVSVNFYNQFQVYQQLKIEEEQIASQIEKEKLASIKLKKQKDYYTSDVYIEKVAREQLGLLMPDEKLFVNRSK